MASNPSEAAQRQFVEKLQQFRGRLTTEEQQMLDALVNAARQPGGDDDVSSYWFSTGLEGSGVQAPGTTGNIWSGYGDQGPWSNKPI